ncbi:hypothetical protein FRC02_009683 [Tulasnella sp. 418]|nr:hypothetical protein FRC02_009683 [Tulasnella sp. 418]
MGLAGRAGISLLAITPLRLASHLQRFRKYFAPRTTGPGDLSRLPVFGHWPITRATHSIPKRLLRPYQEECVTACLEALDQGITRIAVSSPTGSGKTTVFCSLIGRIQPPPDNSRATRALILVNAIELAKQAAEAVRSMYPDLHVEIEQGQKHKASGMADITIATYQTLRNRVDKFDPSQFKVVIVDEAHHSISPSYIEILSRFNSSIIPIGQNIASATTEKIHSVPIVGVSATFSRHDGRALGQVFEHIVYHKEVHDMINGKWLSPITYTTVKVDMDLSSVTVQGRTGDFAPSSLARVLDTDAMHDVVVGTWLDRVSDQRRSTLVFACTVAHVEHLTAKFREAGVDARFIVGKTPASERAQLLEEFKSGKYPVLVNCAVLTEGADIPNIDCLMLARPTKSRNMFSQMIGRGMRLSPETGKTDCRIVDFVDSFSRVEGVVDGPTLLGIIPEAVIDANSEEQSDQDSDVRDIEFMNVEEPRDAVLQPKPLSVTYSEYDDPFSIAGNANGSPSLLKISPLAWVKCGDVYVLECLKKGTLRIQSKPTQLSSKTIWEAWYTPTQETSGDGTSGRATKKVFLRKRKVAEARSLQEAIRHGDSYALTYIIKFNHRHTGLHRNASWRRQPATEAQLNIIRKKFNTSSSKADFETLRKNLTKGQAANIITRLKNGAQAYFEEFSKQEKALQRERDREEKQRAKLEGFIIQVGPLKKHGS